jgi:hypothetical protein
MCAPFRIYRSKHSKRTNNLEKIVPLTNVTIRYKILLNAFVNRFQTPFPPKKHIGMGRKCIRELSNSLRAIAMCTPDLRVS